MGRMKELYENIWFAYVEQGMTTEEIASYYKVPVAWVTGALETAEQDEYYDSIGSKALH
jgi:DNA-binding transcriptional regulator LsrR (DeoR family)